jgi:hypothetical protein
MTRLAHEPDIINLASDLGLADSDDPVLAILDSCRRRIDTWVAETGGVSGIDALETLVTRRLQMAFGEVRTDKDWDRLTEVYARDKKEFVFAGMRTKFDDSDNMIYGALVQRRNAEADSPDRFVAVIDCRGSKLARRFFTRWHEIAHRMTTHCDMQEPVYRSEHDPIERLMDEIAGHIGFYGPIFDSAFRQASEGKPLLTFQTVKSIIGGWFPDASFQATLFACTRRSTTPVVYLEAALDHKKKVKRRLQTPSLFGDEPPPGELRAVKVIPNDAAQRERFTIPVAMRVPESSVISAVFTADEPQDAARREDMGMWSDSKGKRLEGRTIAVEARKLVDRVIAILQPVEPVRQKPQRQRAKGMFDD